MVFLGFIGLGWTASQEDVAAPAGTDKPRILRLSLDYYLSVVLTVVLKLCAAAL